MNLRPFLVLSLALYASSVQAQESPCGDYVRWLGELFPDGVSDAAWAGNNLAVAAQDEGLVFVDPSDPTNPVVLGSESATHANGILVLGDLAYVTNYTPGELAVVDISDPTDPQQLSVQSTGYPASTMTVIGDYGYMGVLVGPGGPVGIERWDLSDPLSPQETGLWSTEYAVTIQLHDGYLYIGREFGGLDVYETSNPAAPTLVGSVGGFRGQPILFNGDIAYVGNAEELEILTLDISDPTRPSILGSTALPDYGLSGLMLHDGYLLANMGTSLGLGFFDISDPLQPTFSHSMLVPHAAGLAALRGNIIFITSGYSGMQLFDLSSVDVPQVVTTTPLQGNDVDSIDVEIAGNYAFVLEQRAGLRVVDVSTPTNPIPVALAATSTSFNYELSLDGDRAYVSNNTHGVSIVDISDPTAPDIVGTVDTPANAYGMAPDGDILYVADDWAGLQVLDVSAPGVGSILVTQPLSGYARDVAFANGMAYVATAAGLEVVDVSDPLLPSLRGSYAPPTSGFGEILVEGDIAYCSGSHRLFILDVSDPDAPLRLADVSTSSKQSPRKASLDAGHLFLGTGWGMMVVDVSDPTAPRLVSQGIGSREVHATARKDGYTFLAADVDGLQVVPLNCEGVVPVLLSHLDHELEDGRVTIRWGASVPDASAFRLRASQGTERWDVAFHRLSDQEFFGVDDVRHRSGTVDYSVQHRSGGDWEPLGQTSVKLQPPARTRLVSASPNPFNPSTTIAFSLARGGTARIGVYNTRGELVRMLRHESYGAAQHSVQWDGLDDSGASVASGSYVIRLESQGATQSMKVLMLK